MSSAQAAGGSAFEGMFAALRDELRAMMREEIERISLAAQPAQEEPLPLLTVSDVATRCGVKPQAVRAWIDSGRLVASKPGHAYRVKAADLETFLTTKRRAPVELARVDDQVASVMGRIGRIR